MPQTLRICSLLLLTATLGCGDSPDASASSAASPTAPAPPAASTAVPARALRGSIDIDPLLGVETGEHACVFLMGWRGLQQGPPQLVRKFESTTMPLSFALDARDLAGAGTIAGDWVLVARLDGDGDAKPGSGDLQGTAPGFVTADGPPVRIFLTEQLTDEDIRHAELFAETSAPGSAPGPHGGTPATTTAGEATKTGPRFRGTIRLADAFADMNGTRTLFVMLKDKTLARGMPRAVLKVDTPRFPLTFDMGIENIPPIGVENPEALLEGQLYLTARLDSDGDFMGAPGDIELAAPVPVTADQKPLNVVLDTRRNP